MTGKNAASNVCRRLIIFDFDQTLIDTDSDNVIPMATGGKHVSGASNWSIWMEYLDGAFRRIHAEYGVKPADICRACGRLPMVAGTPELLKRLSSQPQNQVMVLSDANTVFVENALEGNKLRQCFSRIITNEAQFDEKGRLRLSPNAELAARAGACPTHECPRNLCKGTEIKQLLKEFDDPEIWYVGDGGNDFCAAVSLPSEKHHVFARTGYALHSIISNHLSSRKGAKDGKSSTLKCKASFWRDGHELMEHMARLDPNLKKDDLS